MYASSPLGADDIVSGFSSSSCQPLCMIDGRRYCTILKSRDPPLSNLVFASIGSRGWHAVAVRLARGEGEYGVFTLFILALGVQQKESLGDERRTATSAR